ncbi:hypothetical protein [Prochlorothrix hollandica]|uniref:hypothetical protein n=1 Tax=Prochlorothrix hollandica TaxID=1223 RepID=UPI000363AD60|nr:hypothetical protein [Prochlorothrix hollandica]
MDVKPLIDRLNTLIHHHTGHHLDTLQIAILQGVLQGHKYADIAQTCQCTEGHLKDKAYSLWKHLTPILGEPIKKTNAKAAIERFVIHNTNSPIFENNPPLSLSTLNLCPYPDPTATALHQAQTRAQTTPSSYHSRAILKLHHHGLEPTAIADSLEIPPAFVHITLHPHTSLTP